MGEYRPCRTMAPVGVVGGRQTSENNEQKTENNQMASDFTDCIGKQFFCRTFSDYVLSFGSGGIVLVYPPGNFQKICHIVSCFLFFVSCCYFSPMVPDYKIYSPI